MNIPLDRLYHFIENIVKDLFTDPIIIYRFTPHGSKNINDLTPLNYTTFVDNKTKPKLLCFDQEPTNIEFYNNPPNSGNLIFKSLGVHSSLDGIKFGVIEKNILLHSEKRSTNTDDSVIPVYYWSHAIIARDWFRYAKHEVFKKNAKKIFLIYNRSWSGYREYRIKFADLLVENNLISHCQTTFNAIDPELGLHYSDHKFKTAEWQAKNTLETFLQPTSADATSSADFNKNDYNSTEIEVVLETLFDYSQLHLTEKVLRPIACCQPFILAGTHGSLEYLHSYGFKTFNTVWNEEYDKIRNPVERLNAIVSLMKEIASWNELTRKTKLAEAQKIALYNQQWFLSQDFFDLVVNELKDNLKVGLAELKNYCDNLDWNGQLEYFETNIFNNKEWHDNVDKQNHMKKNIDGLMEIRNFIRKKAGLPS